MNAPFVDNPAARPLPTATRIVGTAAGDARKPSLAIAAWGASGIAHAAVLGAACFWGASSAQFDAPPAGASAIRLRAARVIVVDPVTANHTSASPQVKVAATAHSSASSEAPQAPRVVVSRSGELPPAAGTGRRFAAPPAFENTPIKAPAIARAGSENPPAIDAAPTSHKLQRRTAQVEPPEALTTQADAAADSATEMFAATGADSPPQPLTSINPSPHYPAEALLRRLEGAVIVRASISRQGTIEQARVHTSSGFAILDREALRAVRRWRFEPALRGGIAVRQTVDLPIRFYLAD